MKCFAICFFLFLAQHSLLKAQDIISGGTNQWILHTPDDGRTSLHIAPFMSSLGGYNWDAQTIFFNDGSISVSGTLFIGTLGANSVGSSLERLLVNGKIRAKEIKIEAANWPDYVFKPAYKLMPLYKVESFVKKNGHLPEVPSAKSVEQNGMDIGANQALLLKKIEELTLYVIEQDKINSQQAAEIQSLKRELKKIVTKN
ncbi:MAG: hypothetical protein QM727_00715 [Niabella sp.]